jgi:DNA polymerase-3 subunit epsilon
MVTPAWFEAERQKAIRWARELLQRGFVIFDSETTGLEPDDVMIQAGVIDHTGAVLLDQLVRPHKAIDPDAAAVHGISDDDVAAAPDFAAVYPRLKELLGSGTVVAYNADFDSRILYQTCLWSNLPALPSATWHCAMLRYAQFRGSWNTRSRSFRWHRLTNACAHEGIAVQDAHAAAGDCQMTLQLIQAMAAAD